ncbi:hypothetical protein D3C87_1765390 [compost metagenome]
MCVPIRRGAGLPSIASTMCCRISGWYLLGMPDCTRKLSSSSRSALSTSGSPTTGIAKISLSILPPFTTSMTWQAFL